MKTSLALTVLIAAAVGLSGACGGPKNAANTAPGANSNANSAPKTAAVKDDLDELGMTIALPYLPLDGGWIEDSFDKTGGGTGRKLTAVLLFSKEDADKIVAQAQSRRPPTAEIINTESWFPGELAAKSMTSGDETLKGTSYAADDFFNAPFNEGKATRIEGTDYFIVELFAK